MFIKNMLFKILFKKEGDDMMAMLWAQEIMCDNKTYKQVPRLLKEKVKVILINAGCEDLIIE